MLVISILNRTFEIINSDYNYDHFNQLLVLYQQNADLIKNNIYLFKDIIRHLKQACHNQVLSCMVQQLGNLIQFSEDQQAIQTSEGFIQKVIESNSKGIGISMMDERGHIILLDQETQELLEIKEPKDGICFFDLLTYFSKQKLWKHSDNGVLTSDMNGSEFYCSIYSETNRKNYYKMINQTNKKKIPIKKRNKLADTRRSSESVFMQLKFTKLLKVKYTVVQVLFKEDFVKDMRNQPAFKIDSQALQQAKVIAIVEIQETDLFEEIPMEILQQDSKLMSQEEKLNKKLRKMREKLNQRSCFH